MGNPSSLQGSLSGHPWHEPGGFVGGKSGIGAGGGIVWAGPSGLSETIIKTRKTSRKEAIFIGMYSIYRQV